MKRPLSILRAVNLRFGFISICIAASFVPAASTSAMAQTSDFQIWNDTTLSIPIVKRPGTSGKEETKVSLLLLSTVRLGQNRLYPVDLRVGGGLSFKLDRYLTFAPVYLYRRTEALRNKPAYQHLLRFDLTVGNKWKHFGLKNRNRFDYSIRNSRGDTVTYRNKTTFSVPIRYKDKEIFSPFVAEEPFYDLGAKQWSANEFSAGISRKLNHRTTAEFYYMHVNSKGAIKTVEAVGANFTIVLD